MTLDPISIRWSKSTRSSWIGWQESCSTPARISSTCSGLPFAERLTAIQFETGESYHQHFDIALPKRGVAEQTPISVGPAVFSLLRNETLLDIVESLIGPEIFANPIQHVRLKQPVASAPAAPASESTEAAPDWFHQDNAFMMPEADATEMVTVWLPLVGCRCGKRLPRGGSVQPP